jgi:hypothetical protein
VRAPPPPQNHADVTVRSHCHAEPMVERSSPVKSYMPPVAGREARAAHPAPHWAWPFSFFYHFSFYFSILFFLSYFLVFVWVYFLFIFQKYNDFS